MIYFSLRTTNEKEKRQAKKIIGSIKNAFGKEKIEITDFEQWISIENQDDIRGWVGINDIGYDNKSRLHLFDNDHGNLDIPLECIDTIYCI